MVSIKISGPIFNGNSSNYGPLLRYNKQQYEDYDYQATLKELRTYEVIEDVANLESEIGVIYRSHYNRQVIDAELDKKQISYTPLVSVKPHVFIR
ncbi:hypothetical protein [Fundicoccus ignavus]|uniref:Uncharacterized protein n=1 Tax=Fundicoccus ignavus TaxID=2664442 RepID=A0A844C2H7_9LACT|nr:hypothetical protein [Fundicoccus ignavus]MRJ48419.1 hypothetical protein [Fundicoccus ignavus]